MNFKPIKYLKGYSNYEMSDVGLIIQNKKDGSIVQVDKVASRAELKDDTGKVSKSFGLKTLYWKSWGKPLDTMGEEVTSTKRGRKPKVQKVPKTKKISLTAKKSELISSFALRELQKAVTKRIETGNTVRGLNVYDGKTSECKIILSHPENHKYVLVSLETQSYTKQGIWFMDIDTGKHIKFEPTLHKTGYGDANIQWPKIA